MVKGANHKGVRNTHLFSDVGGGTSGKTAH